MADNIFQRMSAITAEISNVAKNLEVGYGKNRYKAVGEADVLAAVKPIEQKYGVYSYPKSREIVDTGILTTTKADGTESKQLYMRIKTVYRFLCIDNPESYVDIETFADGVDTQDKACGKAMTYADKYALLKAYKIITGDDPDQNASEPMKSFGSDDNLRRAYPPKDELVKFIEQNYDEENLAKIKQYYKVNRVDEMSFEQLVVCYNRKKKS